MFIKQIIVILTLLYPSLTRANENTVLEEVKGQTNQLKCKGKISVGTRILTNGKDCNIELTIILFASLLQVTQCRFADGLQRIPGMKSKATKHKTVGNKNKNLQTNELGIEQGRKSEFSWRRRILLFFPSSFLFLKKQTKINKRN